MGQRESPSYCFSWAALTVKLQSSRSCIDYSAIPTL